MPTAKDIRMLKAIIADKNKKTINKGIYALVSQQSKVVNNGK